MARSTIRIKQGDASTLTETITGLSSLSGYSAKLYIYNSDYSQYASVSGTIAGLVVTYELVNEVTKAFALGTYYFETKIWDSSDHVYTPATGVLIVEQTSENDPS